MVLCDVRWSDAQDCSYGDCKNCTDVALYINDLKMQVFERVKNGFKQRIFTIYIRALI